TRPPSHRASIEEPARSLPQSFVLESAPTAWLPIANEASAAGSVPAVGSGTEDRSEILIEAGMTLASELSLPDVLQRIAELAAEVSGAKYAALGVVGPDGGIMEFVTVGVTAEQRAHIGDLPIGRGVLGKLITEARTIRIPDISKDPASVGFPPNHPPMHSFLGAPVKAGGSVFGNIYLTEKQGAPEFTEEDERTLEVLAVQAGVAIENATARRELERL